MTGQDYLRVYWTHFLTFLPAIVLSFGIFAFAPDPYACVGFLIMNQTLYLAAASAGLSCLPTETFRSLLGKRGVVHTLWSLLFMMIVIFACGLPLIIMVDNWPHAPLRFLIGVVHGAIFGLCMYRIWPVYGLLMVWLGYYLEDKTEGIWWPYDTGDALVEAWRLTRRAQIFWRYSMPAIMSLFGLFFTPVFFAAFVFDNPSPVELVSFAIYSVGLAPLLNLVLAERSFALVGPPSSLAYTFVPRRRKEQPSASDAQLRQAQPKNDSFETEEERPVPSQHESENVRAVQLVLAAKRGDIDSAQYILTETPPLPRQVLETAFVQAYEEKHEAIGLLLLQHGLPATACLEDGTSLLLWATAHGPVILSPVIHALLQAGASPDQVGEAQATPLIWLAGQLDERESDQGRYRVHDSSDFPAIAELMREMIEKGAQVNHTDYSGQTALFFAVEWRNVEGVQVLLNAGADPNMQDRYGVTALMRACSARASDALAIVQLLVERGADPLLQTKDGRTAIAAATATNKKDILEYLISVSQRQHTQPIATGADLVAAAAQGRQDMLDRLLASGLSLESRDQDGRTTLHMAALRRRPEMVLYLLHKGARTETRDNKGMTPLAEAVRQKIPDTVSHLLAAGASVNAANTYGQTPLMLAAGQIQPVNVELLLQHGAHNNATDSSGGTALMYAVQAGGTRNDIEAATKTVRCLLDHQAAVNAVNTDGQTALMFLLGCRETPQRASRNKAILSVLPLLLAAGADIHLQDVSGRTALHFAAEGGHVEPAKQLLTAGARKDIRDTYGETPAQLAAAYQYAELAQLLQE